MNKRNTISSEMFHRAVVEGRRCGPRAGECPRPQKCTGLGKDAVFDYLWGLFTARKDI